MFVSCGEEVRKDTLDEIATRVLALPAGRRRFYVLQELKLDDGCCDECAYAAGAEGGPVRRRMRFARR